MNSDGPRFLYYSNMVTPWQTLGVEMLNGLTTGMSFKFRAGPSVLVLMILVTLLPRKHDILTIVFAASWWQNLTTKYSDSTVTIMLCEEDTYVYEG